MSIDTHQEDVLKEFIALASHQLRSPLITIKWTLEMLDQGDAGALNPEQHTLVKQLMTANNQMVTLVNGLLNISRIEAGRLIIEPIPTDIGALATEIMDQLLLTLQHKHQTFVTSIEPGLPMINLDPNLIRQAIHNLLTNASKYSPENSTIDVTIKKIDAEVEISVTDHGCGIPELAKERIFTKFFRAANAVKYEAEGNGLGLYLTKLVVEASNGRIWFDSKENEGTTFFIHLPLSGSSAKAGDIKLTL